MRPDLEPDTDDGGARATRSDPRRWWALAALVVAALTFGFDITILNVALPTISTELNAGTDALQWMVNAYVLVLAGLMLTCGALGDRYGRRRLLLLALILFAAASLLAAWADTPGLVIAARAVMGLSGAIVLPVTFAVIAVLFGPRERGRAVSITVMATGAGIPLGPIIGGWLLEHFWWGSIFLINVPMAALAAAAIAAAMPETRDPTPPRPDLPGAVLSTTGLLAVVYGFVQAGDRGWTQPAVAAALAAGAGLLAAFTWWELRTDQPMIDLRLFKDRQFLWGSVAGALVTFGLLGLLFVLPQYLQLVRDHDALATGLRLLPLIAGLVIGAPAGEKFAARTGYRGPVATGLLLISAALTAGATTGTTTGYGLVATWLAACGLGIGMALAPAMDAVLAALPPERSGSGTAVTMTLRQTGGALGVAILGSLLAHGYTTRLEPALTTAALPAPAAEHARDSLAGGLAAAARLPNPAQAAALAREAHEAYLHGMTLVLLATAALALASAALTAGLLPGRPTTNDTDDDTAAAPASDTIKEA